jgi:hypothetical protein
MTYAKMIMSQDAMVSVPFPRILNDYPAASSNCLCPIAGIMPSGRRFCTGDSSHQYVTPYCPNLSGSAMGKQAL